MSVSALLTLDASTRGERGHRRLARAFADELVRRGIPIDVPPALDCEAGVAPTRWSDAVWMMQEGVPWLGRRAGDLVPWATKMAVGHRVPAWPVSMDVRRSSSAP